MEDGGKEKGGVSVSIGKERGWGRNEGKQGQRGCLQRLQW